MSGAGKLFTSISSVIGRIIERQKYENLYWELSWDITYVCNMKCTYCPEPRRREHPDVGPAMERIFQLRPKFMQVVGGEPLLVPKVAEHLEAIKKRVNPTILLITNMMVDDHVVRSVVPFVDTLLVSIDGLGEVNKRQRGVDGDVIVERMVRLSEWLRAQGMESPILSTSTVITRQSLDGLLAFGRRMKELLPGVSPGLGIASPYWHPQSFGFDRRLVERLREILAAMRAEGINYYFADGGFPESEASLRAEGTFPRVVSCTRQFFRANLLPDGTVVACKPGYFRRCFVPRMRDYLSEGRYCDAGLLLYRAVQQFIVNKRGTVCYFPCKCTLWLDELLDASADDALPPSAVHLAGKVSQSEIEEANRFLERAYGMKMGKRLCRFLVRGDESG